ncbi:nitrite reductase small subunit NirD [Echinimonas agarilytica]|uniref:Nitrite reductase small subunit NirD n=1 Tax=Echinimonas agarilytica TaxID=1215918 RepID=A0AA41WB42_9GAMM|nr:nitrite reductase small subunit NirD [Echinimonas agarilytica]MCM2681373.1 nitrite reductase small subunit NirD [Echinimonas agarilytica]
MTQQWTPVCEEAVLVPDTGICAKVGDQHVAVFKAAADGEVYAVSNVCPFGNASVLSRGLLGDANGEIYVASPLLKQRFRLKDGICLDDESVTLATYPVRVENGKIEVGA